MASNGSTIADDDGDFGDWIELYNYGDAVVDLGGWWLSDDYDAPLMWGFPEGTLLNPGAYLLVWASGKDDVRNPMQGYWDFMDENSSIQSNRFPIDLTAQLDEDVEFVDGRNSDSQALDFPGAGQVDLSDEIRLAGDFTVAYWFYTRRSWHWHAVSSSTSSVRPIGHNAASRIDLWNPSVNIHLSTPFETREWQHIAIIRQGSEVQIFGNGELVGAAAWDGELSFNQIGGVSAALASWPAYNGILDDMLVLPRAISTDELDQLIAGVHPAPTQFIHLNFAISLSGEEVLLSQPDGALIDELPPTPLRSDISIGRLSGAGTNWLFFDQPTPGWANSSNAFAGILEPPDFSRTTGIYEDSFHLTLSHPDPDAVIVFTTDGSEPDLHNAHGRTYVYKNQYPESPEDPFGDFMEGYFETLIYTNAILIYDRSHEPDRLTQISTTWHQHPPYFPSEPVRKGTVIRAKSYLPGMLPSATKTHTYFTQPAPIDVPIVALAIQENHLFDYYSGVFVAGVDFDTWRQNNPNAATPNSPIGNYNRRGRLWEYPVHVSIFENDTGEPIIHQDAGLRVHGHTARRHSAKSMRLYARNSYGGPNRFEHSLFDHPIAEATNPENTLFKRILLRGSQWGHLGTDVVFQNLIQPIFAGVGRTQYASLFINGEYWGVTSIRDQMTHEHFAHHFDLDPENVIVTSYYQLDSPREDDEELVSQMISLIKDHDLSGDEAFADVVALLCIESYSDALIASIFSGNRQFEYGFWRARDRVGVPFGDGKWRTHVKDFDWTLSTVDYLDVRSLPPYRAGAGVELFDRLLDSPVFQEYFISRFADHLNTTFKQQRIHSLINRYYNELRPHLAEDNERWSRRLFDRNLSNALHEWAHDHPDRQRQFIRQKFNLGPDADITLDVNNSDYGHIRVNTMEITETTLGGVRGSVYPWLGTYFSDIPVDLEAIPARGHRFVGWRQNNQEEYYSVSPTISLMLEHSVELKAVFEPMTLIHEWNFESATDYMMPSHSLGSALLQISPSLTQHISRESSGNGFDTHHLRIDDPLTQEITFRMPSDGYRDLVFSFETRRSAQGPGQQTIYYSVDGDQWMTVTNYAVYNLDPQLRRVEFAFDELTGDNNLFAVRIVFEEEMGGVAGNHRFDNIRLHGRDLPNSPARPFVRQSVQPISMVEGGDAVILSFQDVFENINAATMNAWADEPGRVQVEVHGHELVMAPLRRGAATVTMEVDNGYHDPVTYQLDAMVYIHNQLSPHLADSTVGHWTMEDLGEGFVRDFSPYANHGTLNSDAEFAMRFPDKGAIEMGPSGQIDLDSTTMLSGDFTVSYWFLTRRAINWRVINNDANVAHAIAHRTPYRVLWGSGDVTPFISGFETDAWQHIVFSRRNGNVRVFKNGDLTSKGFWNGSLRINQLGGTIANSSWDGFDGKLGEVMLFDRALSDSEVQALHYSQTAGSLFPHHKLHHWDFNATHGFLVPSFSVGEGAIRCTLEAGSSIVRNDPASDFMTGHLRVNNPLGAELIFDLPTTGYERIGLEYRTRRSTSGAGLQIVWYSTNSVDWVKHSSIEIQADSPQFHFFDFADIDGVSDNHKFSVRITFEQGNGGEAGNNRFDDWTLTGLPIARNNRAPMVEDSIATQSLIQHSDPVMIDLSLYFSDPDNDPLLYTAIAENSEIASLSLDQNLLSIQPLRQGETEVVVSAGDTYHPPASLSFQVFVHPQAHHLAEEPFSWGEWYEGEPDMVFPNHMIFLQGDADDSRLDSRLLRAYNLAPEDCHADDAGTIGFPYNNTRRTRVNGLGEDGIAFINTGQGRDLGGALLALDTREVTEAPVSWLAGTLLENSREYALRLQYRIGTSGDFLNVFDEAGQPVEYRRQTDGDIQPMPPVLLPEEALGQEYVQLLWRYYHVSGDEGPRAQLRLDDIFVGNTAPTPASHLDFTAPLRSSWQSGQTLLPFTIHALDAQGILDPDFASPVTVSVSGDASVSGTTTVAAESGVAVFTNVAIHGADEFVLTAEADGLSSATSSPVRVVSISGYHVPRYIQGNQPDNNDRVPFVYRARIEGLLPNATYRYGNRVVDESDPWDQDGGGNMIFVTGADTGWIRNTDSPRFRANDVGGRHWTFMTDAEGAHEGWFVTEPTGNRRFVPGDTLFMRILLNDGQGGEELEHYLTLPDPVTVIRFGSNPDEASGITSSTVSPVRNLVFLYDHDFGTDRPLAGVPVERTGSELDDRYVAFYQHVLPDAWAALIPNYLTGGVKRVETRSLIDDQLLLSSRFDQGIPGTIELASGSTPLSVVVRPAPADFSVWQQIYFDAAELADETISGALADPDDSGVPNLLRYALGMGREEPVTEHLPFAGADEDNVLFSYYRLRHPDAGLVYEVEVSESLLDSDAWRNAVMELDLIERFVTPKADGVMEVIEYEVPLETLSEPKYFRLRIRAQ